MGTLSGEVNHPKMAGSFLERLEQQAHLTFLPSVSQFVLGAWP